MDKSGSLLVKWKGFDSPESLREIVGWEIFWEGEDDWVPDDPEIERLDDLVGFVVRDCDDEQAVGFISGYYDRPGQDLLAIETATGQEVLCPFVLELVPKVDRGNREVFVRWSIVGTSG
jgi:RimM protein, required for 16S rRNA processing